MLATIAPYHYARPAAANSAAGGENPNTSRRTSAPSIGAFFASVGYGGCAWDASERAGFLECRFLTPRTVATQPREKGRGDSSTLGVRPMATLRLPFPRITRTLSARAAAHRAMAKAALFADSSAAVRLKRYNHHMNKARHLEAASGAQEVQS